MRHPISCTSSIALRNCAAARSRRLRELQRPIAIHRDAPHHHHAFLKTVDLTLRFLRTSVFRFNRRPKESIHLAESGLALPRV